MKVIVVAILTIGSVSALGSGPYLPSGWRPKGPAFLLPGEVQKPEDNPHKDTIFFETEAAGSDSLQEYGPPKVQEVSQNVINQGLPDVVTEQTFLITEDKGRVSAVVVEETGATEVNAERKSEVVQEAITEAQFAEEQTTETYARFADFEVETDLTTVSYAETEAVLKSEEIQATLATVEEKLEDKSGETQAIVTTVEEKLEDKSEETQAIVAIVEEKLEAKSEETEGTVATVEEKLEAKSEETEATVAIVEEKLEEVVAEQVETVEAGVKNIAEALGNLENEIKAEQVLSEAVAEVKVSQEDAGSAQLPEGFLEYGPPGFREYGPPKGDELLRSAAVIQEPVNSISVESNEARRRRFSPKFRASKNKRIH